VSREQQARDIVLKARNSGLSWRQVCTELGLKVSAAMVSRFAGGERSPTIVKALVPPRRRYRLALEFDTLEERDMFRAMLEEFGDSRREQSGRLLNVLSIGDTP